MFFIRKIIRYISPLLGIAIICLIGNSSINQHFHKLPTGIIEKHAHPYKKDQPGDPFQKHEHSSFEYFILTQLSIVFVTLSVLVLLLLISLKYSDIRRVSLIRIYKGADLYFLLNYHAPPSASW